MEEGIRVGGRPPHPPDRNAGIVLKINKERLKALSSAGK
jgi:hypothetical protein